MEHFRVYITENPNRNDQLGEIADGNAFQWSIAVVGVCKSWTLPIAATLTQAFINAGWLISGLSVQYSIDIDGEISPYNAVVLISAKVFDSFSQSDVENGAAKVLGQFFDVRESAAVNAGRTQINTVKNATQTAGVFGVLSNTTKTNTTKTTNQNAVVAGNSNDKGFADYVSQFFNSLGSGLGVSTPIVAGSLLILAVVLIKNK